MATGTADPNYYGTLAADAIDTVTTTESTQTVWILNRTGSAEIFYTTDGSDPDVSGHSQTQGLVLASVGGVRVQGSDQPMTVKLVSAGAPAYAVITGGGSQV